MIRRREWPSLKTIRIACAVIALGASTLLATRARATDAMLVVGTTSGAPGDDVALDLTFTPGDVVISALQFSLVLPPELAFVSAAAGPAATAADKLVQCANGTCLVFGFNITEIDSGIVATVTLHVSPDAIAEVAPVGLTGLVASTPAGTETAMTGTDGSVTVLRPDFLCYQTRPARPTAGQSFPRFIRHLGVVVVDRLSSSDPADQHEVDLLSAVSLCNPADRDGGDPAAPADAGHLEGYRAKLTATTPQQPAFVHSNQQVTNAFGTLVLALKSVDSVLAASAKAIGSGGVPPLSGSTLDHFKCYKVAVARAGAGQPFPVFTPQHVMLVDEFGGPHAYDLSKPTKLCAPADVAGNDATASSHGAHLVCYQAKLAKQPPEPRFVATTVSTTNQFGTEVIDAKTIAELCVVSTASALP
jgi:hypothetical protein